MMRWNQGMMTMRLRFDAHVERAFFKASPAHQPGLGLKRSAKALDAGWQELDGHCAIEAELQAFANGPHAATADEHVNFMVRQDFLQLRRCSAAEEWDGRHHSWLSQGMGG